MHCLHFFLRMLSSFPTGPLFTQTDNTQIISALKTSPARELMQMGLLEAKSHTLYLGYPVMHPALPIIPAGFSLSCCCPVLLQPLLQRFQHRPGLLQGLCKPHRQISATPSRFQNTQNKKLPFSSPSSENSIGKFHYKHCCYSLLTFSSITNPEQNQIGSAANNTQEH